MLRQPLQPLLRPLLRRIDEQANGWPVPSMSLNFLSDASLDNRITFTRASGATRINSAGLIETVASNSPRFDYNPVTLQPRGLLIEEQRTNLLTYSEQFDNAAWSKTNATVTANAATAPDNTLTADLVIPSTASGNHTSSQYAVTAAIGSTYSVSVYAKASGYSWVRLSLGGVAGGGYAFFDVSSGTTGVISDRPGDSAAIVSCGNGWYRCSFTASVVTAGTLYQDIYIQSANNQFSFTGDGTSGIYIWGAQLEAGSFPTSYIPTTTAAVTRAADVAKMEGANFSSWYRQDEGTLFAEFGPYGNGGASRNPGILQIDDATTNNLARMFAGSSVSPVFGVTASGVSQTYLSFGDIASNSVSKIAAAYKTNDFSRSYNGNSAITDSSGTIPVVSRMLIGTGTGGVNDLNGHIRRIAYFPRRLSNAELQRITA